MQRIDIIERKIKTAKDLRSIVKTMKVLAAVSVSQYDAALESITGYFQTIEQGLRILLKNQLNVAGLLQSSPNSDSTKEVALIFGSGQPMCGSFNEVLSNYVQENWNKDHRWPPDKKVAIGHRIIPAMERIGWQIDHQFDVPSTIDGINEIVQSLVVSIQQWYAEEGFQKVYLYYNQPESNASYSPTWQQLLPIDTSWLEMLSNRSWESRTLPKYSMQEEVLFSALIKQFLFVSVYKAFSESLSAENNSRLVAMQLAEKKIEEKLEVLIKSYRNQRQINITEEILDIIASYEVLRGAEEVPNPKDHTGAKE
ncbi:MAG TPA: FoF1 ATP synthase subunit gamma [Balneolaceae bacterium]|nr:FoF1 ATP synthase subunit gamma [Balneolaceae bacterium]